MKQQIENLCIQAQQAANSVAHANSDIKNRALSAIATQITHRATDILAVNEKEIAQAKAKQHTTAFIDRLTLNKHGLANSVKGLHAINQLADPVGKILKQWQVPSGLDITRMSVPLGVVGVIYESRPNVTIDAAALCLKAGDAVILRGGSECENTNRILVTSIQQGLLQAGLPAETVQYVPVQDREAVKILLTMDNYIDVIIPRGGKNLIEMIRKHSRIPVFSHLDGNCHTYIHQDADPSMAKEIILNAKLRRTGICGATETLLIDKAIAAEFLPDIINALIEQGCELRGDSFTQKLDSRVKAATKTDWQTEYLDAILAIKTVADLDAAVEHINHYGSQHTDAIVTNNAEAAKQFQQRINSAIVMHNCSTQFADGGEFGMGAEIGIATGKLHARGPVGVEQLTTFKYQVTGSGQTRA